MENKEIPQTRPKKTLDRNSPGRGPGRPAVDYKFVLASAYHARLLLEQHWDAVGDLLVKAKTIKEVEDALEAGPQHMRQHFLPEEALILKVVQEPLFPKTRNAQIKFLGDSLGARGRVSARRSRDICAADRSAVVNYIIRQEYYIECTCGYKGPALHGACAQCGTSKIKPQPGIEWGVGWVNS